MQKHAFVADFAIMFQFSIVYLESYRLQHVVRTVTHKINIPPSLNSPLMLDKYTEFLMNRKRL
jgi:hypothetical protein